MDYNPGIIISTIGKLYQVKKNFSYMDFD